MSASHDECSLAQQLTDATRAGRLSDAYRILQGIPYKNLLGVALDAGYTCIATKNQRDFKAHLVSQVATASRRKTDGWGLRGGTAPADVKPPPASTG